MCCPAIWAMMGSQAWGPTPMVGPQGSPRNRGGNATASLTRHSACEACKLPGQSTGLQLPRFCVTAFPLGHICCARQVPGIPPPQVANTESCAACDVVAMPPALPAAGG